jgi:hypothetical protein
MDPVMMLSGMSADGLGPEDAGITIAINGMTEFIKDEIKGLGFEKAMIRVYPFLPFACAFLYCLATEPGLMEAAKSALIYGASATVAYRLHKDTKRH